MNLRSLVWKELRQRPTALLTSGLSVLLGVAALVAIRHVVAASEGEVGRQMERLGANVLILPKQASLQNYYAADMQQHTLPESHVSRVLLEGLPGVEKLSPRLCKSVKVGDREVTLTGILPQSEFEGSAAWQSVKLFKRKHAGCTKAACGPKAADLSTDVLVKQRTIQELKDDEIVVGAEVAEMAGIKSGRTVTLLGEPFKAVGVLPRTGTIDDSRVFAHLHTVQRLAKAGEVVSAIEVLGCCEDAAGQLVPQLAELLPDAKVVTISHVVEAQVGVNRLMANLSLFVTLILVVVGGSSVAGAIAANVRDRRREIGTLMALGACPGYVVRLFLLKALWIGLAAGTVGAAIGLVAAVWWGPQWAATAVEPLPGLTLAAVGVATVVSLAAAYWPARRAAQLDPCLCFKET
jgi:putative ABC transport system permease protein